MSAVTPPPWLSSLQLTNWIVKGRRYFRLFKWIDCWNMAYSQYQSYLAPRQDARAPKEASTRPPPARDNVHFLLLVSKWSLLGMYMFLEMFTIVSTDAPFRRGRDDAESCLSLKNMG